MSFKLALLVPSMRTPFAVLMILGAATAAYGVLRLGFAETELENDDRFDYRRRGLLDPIQKTHMSPDELRADLGMLENGYFLMLAGVFMIAIGMIPFVAERGS